MNLSFEPNEIPVGRDYQWVTSTIGREKIPVDEFTKNGWHPVPLSRHPRFASKSVSDQHIEVCGVILVERPQQLTDASIQWEKKKADAQRKNLARTEVPRDRTIKEHAIRSVWKSRNWLLNRFSKEA